MFSRRCRYCALILRLPDAGVYFFSMPVDICRDDVAAYERRRYDAAADTHSPAAADMSLRDNIVAAHLYHFT